MQSFDKLFFESKGQPIRYNNKEICLADKFPVKNKETLILSIEESSNLRRQGVCMDITGHAEIGGKILKAGKGVRLFLWKDTTPEKIEIKIITKKTFVIVYNICEWELPRTNNIADDFMKTVDYGHNGAAMIVEEIENGRRYRCSDTSSSEKPFPFNDIVFTVKKIDSI